MVNPSKSSGSGQDKRVRFSDQEHLDPKPECDTEIQTGGQRTPVARKRSVETDAERLEEETAEADSDKRVALKRKAEGDRSDSDVEDSAMNSLAELWHIASVHETSCDKPVCEEPKTHSPYDECRWDYIDDTGGKLLNNTLVEKARPKKKTAIREFDAWEVVDRPRERGRVWHAVG